ncbi:MAG: hypothetical protein PVTTEEND_000498 [Candidatus Fervidibacter sp.]|jgi:Neutral/alkaline non-lysosomal ceramidase.
MLLGIGKTVITPPIGTPLAGFAHRDHGAESVLDDLEVRAFWLQSASDADDAICLITADLIGFGAKLTAKLRSELKSRYGLPPERLLLAASHTHSGPQTCENMVGVGEMVAEVVAMVQERILEAVAIAHQYLRPVVVSVGGGRCEGYAINRRLVRDGVCLFAPNPDGVRDDEVTVLVFRDAQDGTILAVLFHFTCHPTVMGDYRITADYPGAARRVIERAFNGTVAGFLPGCFGDVRPNCTFIGGTKFRQGQPEDVALFGEALGNEVVRVAQEAMDPLTPKLDGWALTVELPLLPLADGSLPNPPTCPLTIQRLDIAEQVSLIALSGEACCDYGWFIKRLGMERGRMLIPLGYCNGLVGYLCPARYFPEGGYESATSFRVFGLPSPFAPTIEGVICDGIRQLLSLGRGKES